MKEETGRTETGSIEVLIGFVCREWQKVLDLPYFAENFMRYSLLYRDKLGGS